MTDREEAKECRTLERAARVDAAAERPWFMGASGVVFVVVAVLACFDLVADEQGWGGLFHGSLELAIMAIALTASAIVWSRFVALCRRERVLTRDLDRARAEAERWQTEANDHLRGLGAAIDTQFDRWDLSPAEREVALLLLKGLALKDIAELRATSERTVRQQSLSVYRKAGLAGRAELAAFFLEDLLLPGDPVARVVPTPVTGVGG